MIVCLHWSNAPLDFLLRKDLLMMFRHLMADEKLKTPSSCLFTSFFRMSVVITMNAVQHKCYHSNNLNAVYRLLRLCLAWCKHYPLNVKYMYLPYPTLTKRNYVSRNNSILYWYSPCTDLKSISEGNKYLYMQTGTQKPEISDCKGCMNWTSESILYKLRTSFFGFFLLDECSFLLMLSEAV